MRFTMAQPEVSCHPGAAARRARARSSSAALCYYVPGPEPGPGEGRLPRYAWRDHYAELRERLDALGRRLGGALPRARRREPARRPRGRRRAGRRLLRQEHDADHAHARLLGRARHARHRRRDRADAAARPRLRLAAGSASTPARRGRSTSRACSTRTAASRTGRRRHTPIPEPYREELGRVGLRLRHLPGRVPLEPRRREAARRATAPAGDAEPNVSLVDWLERDGAELVAELDRLYVPRNDPRWLRRNALVALGNTGGRSMRRLAERWARERRRDARARRRRGRCERIAERAG